MAHIQDEDVAVAQISMSSCKAYLQTLASFGVAVGDFYLLLGHTFEAQALPEGFARGEPRACYRNAAQLVFANPHLTYCEGYAMPSGLIPVHHAWCVARDGRVIDPTWPHCAQAEYFGIALSATWLMGKLATDGTWGLLAECIPRDWLAVEPTAYLDEAWLPEAERLQEFEAKRRSWRSLA